MYITESQDGWCCKDHRGSPGPTSLPKQGPPDHHIQNCVQVAFECLQRRRFHNFPEQPVPALSQLHSKVLPHVWVELPMFQFLPLVSHSYCWNCWEEPGYILLAPFLQILVYIDKVLSQSSPLQAKKYGVLYELAYHVISLMLHFSSSALFWPCPGKIRYSLHITDILVEKSQLDPPQPFHFFCHMTADVVGIQLIKITFTYTVNQSVPLFNAENCH